jgi:hypothetical protein
MFSTPPALWRLEEIPICSYITMDFEWDSAKDATNQSKHGIGFREAAEIFRGLIVVSDDTRIRRRRNPGGFHGTRQQRPYHLSVEGKPK